METPRSALGNDNGKVAAGSKRNRAVLNRWRLNLQVGWRRIPGGLDPVQYFGVVDVVVRVILVLLLLVRVGGQLGHVLLVSIRYCDNK
jgi:hypothetical protein